MDVPPCAQCSFFQARTGWPYYCLVRGNTIDTMDEAASYRLAPEIPREEWEMGLSPKAPTMPMLFLYGGCDYGTYQDTCSKRTLYFHEPAFLEYLESRNDGSEYHEIKGGDHWLADRAPAETNGIMDIWLKSMD